MFYDLFAFVVFALLGGAVVAAIVLLGGLPGDVARKRGHPQADAVAVAGWLGVASLGILWPLALIWAFHRPTSLSAADRAESTDASDRLASLESAVARLEQAASAARSASE